MPTKQASVSKKTPSGKAARRHAAQNATQPTPISVEKFLNGIEHPGRREDAKTLAKLFASVTGQKPRMWGSAIVGFGQYHFVYDSGREGDTLRIGFSPRSQNLVLYIMQGFRGFSGDRAKLGKHVFFSENIVHGDAWSSAINNALESTACKYLVVVGTNRTSITRRWVDYEYTIFHQLILSERKPESSKIIPFVGFDRRTLPLPLAYYNAIEVKPGGLESALKKLENALAEES